jgi:eukaryotic-like serine/threonine-protein kinase
LSVELLADGRYRVERTLGRGGMATVYLAADSELGRSVAVKVLADNLAGDNTFRERFLREARLAAGLSHPNVVNVFDVGETDGRPFIVMEYVEGETVADELRASGAMSPEHAVDLALQACAGLEAAHASGLVHRDVKPQNLLVRPDGTLKIADFGIARAAESTRLTEIGTILGSAAYLSPEQAAGGETTPAADVYSLGAVLYELLTGRTPYTASTLVELVNKQRAGSLLPVRSVAPGVSAEVEDVVMRCLSPVPEQRPATAGELARELAAAAPEPPTVPLPATTDTGAATLPFTSVPAPPPFATPAARQLGSQRRRWVVLALAAVAVAALVVGLRGRGGAPPAPRVVPAVVAPVPHGSTPAADARNLARWLRAHARR